MPPGAVGRGAERGGGAMVVEKRSKKASAEGGGVIGSRQRLSSMASLPSLDRASFLALRKGVARALWRSYQGRDALGWVTGSWTAEARAPARRIRRLQRAGGGGGKSEPGRFGALVFCPRGLFSPRRLCNKKYKLSLSPPPSSGSVPLRGDVDRPTASGLTLCGCG
jgi:hypothetical protein